MKEIRFRGKSVKTGKWVCGHLIEVCGEAFIVNTDDDGWVTAIDQYDITYHKVIPNTISQYTGLKDIDGKEIYEGDIAEKEVNEAKRELVEEKETIIKDLAKLEAMRQANNSEIATSMTSYTLIEAINLLKNSIVVENPIDYTSTKESSHKMLNELLK